MKDGRGREARIAARRLAELAERAVKTQDLERRRGVEGAGAGSIRRRATTHWSARSPIDEDELPSSSETRLEAPGNGRALIL